MFRKFRSALVRGLVVVLPIGFTIWLLWWIGSTTESLLRRLIVLFVPPEFYMPGMGIAAALLLLLAAGTLFNALLVQSALAAWERFLDRIPVVKTIYGATRDFVKLLPTGGKRRDLRRVVLARFGDARVIGFVTQDDASELGIVDAGEGLVAVYFPMSYQIGGYTALLPRSRIETLEIPVEAAMRMVLTGGISGAAA
ncbi:MAG TPA: DUF502 domain-containing protein [Steroidobacteraceae bacterium]|nr:DUF502 domain-containing protein [Steroidobacteraceae bacterium]